MIDMTKKEQAAFVAAMKRLAKRPNWNDAVARMEKLATMLTAYDFDGNTVVHVRHEDGTDLRFTHAKVLKLGKKYDKYWAAVVTEHNGWHVFSLDDCTVNTYKRV